MTSDDRLMAGVTIGLGTLGAIAGARALLRRCGVVLATPEGDRPTELLRWAIRDPETRSRIRLSLAALAGAMLLRCIPVPGWDGTVLAPWSFARSSGAEPGGGIGLAARLATIYHSPSIFGLGLRPFIVACVFLQVAAWLVRPLREALVTGTGAAGRAALWARCLAFLLALYQGYNLAAGNDPRLLIALVGGGRRRDAHAGGDLPATSPDRRARDPLRLRPNEQCRAQSRAGAPTGLEASESHCCRPARGRGRRTVAHTPRSAPSVVLLRVDGWRRAPVAGRAGPGES